MNTEELYRAICGVSVVGQIDGHDVIRRSSVLDLIEQASAGKMPSDRIMGAMIQALAKHDVMFTSKQMLCDVYFAALERRRVVIGTKGESIPLSDLLTSEETLYTKRKE